MILNRKILVSDYDNTFYLNDDDIEKNKLAIEKFRKDGNIFVIATGRSYFDLQRKVDKYHFEYDYAIINHGATIVDGDNNVLFNFPINNCILNSLQKDLILDRTIKMFCCSILESRVDFNHLDLTKIALTYEDSIEVEKLENKIKSKYRDINIYLVTKNMLEIISHDIDKSKAIRLLSNYLNVDLGDIYTIGDGYSDITMIKDYNGYAMENSVEELKSIAGKTYHSVSELVFDVSKNNTCKKR